jgi:murein DD-endopeptidase MepM/ murein hydrolase activator NlpD
MNSNFLVKNETFDVVIELGKAPSKIGEGIYKQNCLFAGLDKQSVYHPIGHVIKNSSYYYKYYKEMNWSSFIIPYEGRPYVGKLNNNNVKLSFYATPCIKKDGVIFINFLEEGTAKDILGKAARSAIGVHDDGTIELYTTYDKITLEQLALRMPNCVDILNLDGGGSVSPASGLERRTSSAIIINKGGSMKYFEDFTRMSSGYGKRISPISGKEEFHSGIDLVKKHQGDIKCIVGGKVVHAKMAEKFTGVGGYGNAVCIIDKNKNLHLYGHLHEIKCKENDNVIEGDIIGTQGNTGQSAGSHLHYEIRSKSLPTFGWGFHIDPIAYLNKYFSDIPKDWKQEGLEYLQKEYGISKDWKSTDTVDLGLLGTILRRKK